MLRNLGSSATTIFVVAEGSRSMVVYNVRGLIYQNGDDVDNLEYFRIQPTGMGSGFGVLMGTRESVQKQYIHVSWPSVGANTIITPDGWVTRPIG